jgi:hypothetical protein
MEVSVYPDTILIAGAGPELLAALSSEAEKNGKKTAIAPIQDRNGGNRFPKDAAGKNAVVLDLNPGSPISVHTAVCAAQNAIGTLDAAIIVCAAPGNAETRDFSPAGIDALVNNHIKSYMFLSYEMVRLFQKCKSGALALALLEEPSSSLLESSVFSAFRSFSTSLLSHPNTEYIRMAAFLCDEKKTTPVNEFAAYIFKTMLENKKLDRSRWFRFTKFKLLQ